MLLRRITQHVKDQSWFAVFIDLVIVVVGVFIGIQVANWNEARADKLREAAILDQLATEFSEVKVTTEKQISIRQGWADSLFRLVRGLEQSGPMPTDAEIKEALNAARATGRRPPESSAYIQLTASGELARLSSDDLKQALIRYHTLLERDAFIFPELMRHAVTEISTNEYVDMVLDKRNVGAAVDQSEEERKRGNEISIRAYDLEGLKKHEKRYELAYLLHQNLVLTDKVLLELINQILAHSQPQKD